MIVAVALSAFELLSLNPQTGRGSKVPEEDYSFLSVEDDRCIPKIGIGIDPKFEADCRKMSEPRRYRGTWLVGFETSVFRPAGQSPCTEGLTLDYCPDAILEGKALPWPSRWACLRMYEIDFVGRRKMFPGPDMNYKVVVDQLISAKRISDPVYQQDDCDKSAP